ncbi:Uncharacterised protein r2_g3774 [Pycnogonum litorale]
MSNFVPIRSCTLVDDRKDAISRASGQKVAELSFLDRVANSIIRARTVVEGDLWAEMAGIYPIVQLTRCPLLQLIARSQVHLARFQYPRSRITNRAIEGINSNLRFILVETSNFSSRVRIPPE